MASALPVLSGREVVRVFESFGWEFARQSASHIILVKAKQQHRLFQIIVRWQKELRVALFVLLDSQ